MWDWCCDGQSKVGDLQSRSLHTERKICKKTEGINNANKGASASQLSLPNDDQNYSIKKYINGGIVYVYNRDKSILYFYTNNRKNFLQNLNIHYATFEKHLQKGTYYLGRYLFSDNLEPTAKFKGKTLFKLALELEKNRKSLKKR